jgi:hypothetical protein
MLALTLFDVILYLGTGALVGLLAGLLGVGGGLVVVPILIYLLPLSGVPTSLVTHMAVATSLATIVVTSIASVRAHSRHGSVIWWVFKAMTPGVVVGGLLGSSLAKYTPADTLKTLFGVFALLIALQMIFRFRPAPHRQEPGKTGLFAAGALIGSFSTLVGIGGGSITVPFLTYWNTSMSRAVGTAAAVGLPLSVAGTLGFVVNGWNHPQLPPLSLGYVYLPAFLGIVLVSSQTAPLGARLAQKLPARILARIFASFLVVVGLDILLH